MHDGRHPHEKRLAPVPRAVHLRQVAAAAKELAARGVKDRAHAWVRFTDDRRVEQFLRHLGVQRICVVRPVQGDRRDIVGDVEFYGFICAPTRLRVSRSRAVLSTV